MAPRVWHTLVSTTQALWPTFSNHQIYQLQRAETESAPNVVRLLSAESKSPPKVPIYPYSAPKLKPKFGRPLVLFIYWRKTVHHSTHSPRLQCQKFCCRWSSNVEQSVSPQRDDVQHFSRMNCTCFATTLALQWNVIIACHKYPHYSLHDATLWWCYQETHQSREVWKDVGNIWKRLIVDNVPVKHIHLVLRHRLLQRQQTATYVNMLQASFINTTTHSEQLSIDTGNSIRLACVSFTRYHTILVLDEGGQLTTVELTDKLFLILWSSNDYSAD